MTLSLSLSAFCQPAQRSRRTKPSKFKAIQSSWSNGNVLDILFDFNPNRKVHKRLSAQMSATAS